MSLTSLLQKIPNTHIIPSNSLRGEIINLTFNQLNKRADLSFDYYQYKTLAILLAGLDIDSFTSDELTLLLSYDWNKLEIINAAPIKSQLSPASYQMETNLNKPEIEQIYRKRKFATLKQYIINGV